MCYVAQMLSMTTTSIVVLERSPLSISDIKSSVTLVILLFEQGLMARCVEDE